jgi:hypothetical protein
MRILTNFGGQSELIRENLWRNSPILYFLAAGKSIDGLAFAATAC